MTKKQSAIAASVKGATRGKAAFVFASATAKMPKTADDLTAALGLAKFAKFGCTACGTAVHSRADTAPFCITCGAGDDHVHQIESNVKTEVTAKSDLVSLDCSLCSASTIIEANVATAITSSSKTGSTPIHCSCCGNPLTVTAATEPTDPQNLGDSGTISQGPLKTPDPAPTPTATMADADMEDDDDLDLDNLGSLEDMDEADDDGADGDFDFDDDDEPVVVTSDPSTLTTPGGSVPPEDFAKPEPEDGGMDDALELDPFSIEQVAEVAPPTEPAATGFATEDDDGLEDDVIEIKDEAEGDALVDSLSLDDTEKAVAFVQANGRLVVMKGHAAIATLSPKSKSVNAGLTKSPALIAATLSSISNEGLRAGLKSIGFELIKTPVTSKVAIERRAQEITAKVNGADAKRQKVFAQSVALAAAGLNRGQWKGVANPLRAALETELTRVGVEAPRRVVSAVFEAAGLEYAQTLFSTANRLTKMSASARDDLSEVLNMTANVSPDEELDDVTEGNPEAAPIEARFATGGKTTAALLRPREGASSQSITAASAILAGKAELNFSF